VPVRAVTTRIVVVSIERDPSLSALVVDDDAAIRVLVRVNLELEGFAVNRGRHVGRGGAAVERERPAVVLLDVHLGADDTAGCCGACARTASR